MGATSFVVKAKGKNAQAAFNRTVKEYQHEHGHGGYTGTIAEKTTFEMITPPPNDPIQYIQSLLDKGGGFWDDKWGPAACFEFNGEFWFFGWASE